MSIDVSAALAVELPDELREVQQLARSFVQRELAPLEREVEDSGVLSAERRLALRKKAVDLGFWNCMAPVEYGGSGMGLWTVVVMYEELGRVSQAVGFGGNILFANMEKRLRLGIAGNNYLRDKYYLPYIRGECDCFSAITEPEAGSDVTAMQTRAVRDGDSYVINGSKAFIGNVDKGDIGIVVAVTAQDSDGSGKRLSSFIVDRDAPGMVIGREIPMMGRRGEKHFELSFADCRIPALNMIGQDGAGLRNTLSTMTEARLRVSACAIGAAERALEAMITHAQQRSTFGVLLANRQAVQEMITQTATDIYAARAMTYAAARDVEAGRDVRTKVSLTKVFATEMAFRATDRAMQVHGGGGYSKDLPIEMMFRDARLSRIIDGASEVLNWYAARQLTGVPLS